ncbi:nuclear transport factor 2 family protein [Pseudoalteromonas sp. SMS1]|uniref:nuclear transport factor 2 family protein n=1 Tax=Pseudoalteromonas sp. SMS1 TaxID=2908894 RepID=UPI001F1CCD2A|nr:nuclear transport factor 2 family protein [Pseudoalteromonas sp. SMS1]MCF2859772.1 nuclear transport factor 2 family protein [Pseudoalteromonas sp. SMS1]
MVRSFVIVISLIVFSLTAWCANAHKFTTPKSAIQSYISGVSEGVGKNVEMAFQKSATIQFYDSKGKFNSFQRDEFIKLIDTGKKWNVEVEITHLSMTKHAANATVEFIWGKNSEHGFVDYLNLMFDGEKWQITNKVAQYVSRNSDAQVEKAPVDIKR